MQFQSWGYLLSTTLSMRMKDIAENDENRNKYRSRRKCRNGKMENAGGHERNITSVACSHHLRFRTWERIILCVCGSWEKTIKGRDFFRALKHWFLSEISAYPQCWDPSTLRYSDSAILIPKVFELSCVTPLSTSKSLSISHLHFTTSTTKTIY